MYEMQYLEALTQKDKRRQDAIKRLNQYAKGDYYTYGHDPHQQTRDELVAVHGSWLYDEGLI